MPVLSDPSIAKNILRFGFAVIGKVKDMKHVVLLLLHHFPAEVYDRLESERLMILLPAVTDKDRIRLREWDELKLCLINGHSMRSACGTC